MRARILVLLLPAAAATLGAQAPPGEAARRFAVRGEVGSSAELYGISGREARRPGESVQAHFTPTVSFGSLTITGNFLVSTEGSSSVGLGGLPGRQRLNQFGVSPQWRWGKAHLGSFSDTYTPLTWSGVRVDGAGIDLTPGRWRAGFFGGTTRQPVFGGATSGSYGRTIVGARVGAGQRPQFGRRGTYLDLIFLRAADDPSSLPPLAPDTPIPYLPDSLANEPDTLLLPRVPINPYAVTPQENAVLATAAGVSLFGGALAWTGELAGSIHSRDRRAALVAEEYLEDYPRILRGLVSPRSGTHADYAYKTQLDVRIARLPGATARSPRSLTASVGWQSIGPGYVSLGTAYLPNDLRGVDARAALRLRRATLQVDGSRQHDNLLNQKLATTDRSRIGATVTAQPLPSWHAAVRATRVAMDRDLADSLGGIAYSARVLSTSQSWIPGGSSRIRSLTASYTYQHIGDANPLRAASTLRSNGVDLRLAVALSPEVGLSPAVGLVRSRTGDSSAVSRATYGLAGDWRGRNRRWTATAAVNRSQVSRTSALTMRAGSRLRVSNADQITFEFRASRYRSLVQQGLDFTERTIQLRWSRQL